MKTLLAKAAADQWSPDDDIDWHLPIRYPLWFRRRTYIKTISQFYHGERLTQRVCKRLLTLIDDPLEQQFIRQQLSDEQKHERVFAGYIKRMGEIAPIEPALAKALEGSLAWRGSKWGEPIGLIVAFHLVFEGGAISLLERLVRRFPCPLFRHINARVVADEARHIAFGRKFIRAHLADVSAAERLEIYLYVEKLWLECAATAARRYSLPVALVTRIGVNWLALNWRQQKRQLIKIGLVTVAEAALAARQT